MPKKQLLLESLAAALILLFIYASLSKFIAWKTFYGEMHKQPLPRSWTPFLVWIVPCTEIAVSVCLLFERTRLWGFIGSLVVMGLFSLYASAILFHFFGYVPCSCGGVIKNLTWMQHLVLNLFFVAVAITGIVLQRRKPFQNIHFSNIKTT